VYKEDGTQILRPIEDHPIYTPFSPK